MENQKKPFIGHYTNAVVDEGTSAQLQVCKDLCYDYNLLRPSLLEEREALMRQILGHTGRQFRIEQPFHCDYGFNITIGEAFFSNFNCVILDEAAVSFGDHVFVGPNCSFYTAIHPLDAATRNTGLEYQAPITVGNSVWFGGNVTVLPGVTIGDKCVIGAGSVVTRDIPAGSLAVGNPCRVVRKIE